MHTYTLFLDESGNFKEQSAKPSIVAGYMIDGYFDEEEWAKSLMEEVKASDSKFINIKTDKFHGMEDNSLEMKEYCAAVIEELHKRGARIVSFKSKRHRAVVNSDVTYLNVFSTGIIKLFEQLLVEAKDSVKIHIVYAHRIKVELKEALGVIERIDEGYYRDRIEEHIVLKEMQLPSNLQNNFFYNLKTGSATKAPLLMLADAINYGLRGGWQGFKAEIKNRIRNVPCMLFEVSENDRWEQIKNNLLQDNLATSVFAWYSDEDPALYENKPAFEDMLKALLSTIKRDNLSLQLDMLANNIKSVINLRQFSLADQIIERLINEFVPTLRDAGIATDLFEFDLCFYRLTSATHQGDTKEEERCIELCDSKLPDLELDFNTLGYFFNYKLRVAEHFKNIFEFEKAINMLDTLIAQQKDMVESLGLIPGLEDWAARVKSRNLGKLYSSRLSTRSYIKNSEEQYALGQKDYKSGLEQFTNVGDKKRLYQNLCMLEYMYDNYDKALEMLALAVGINKDFGPKEILNAILEDRYNKDFLLMHYTCLMAEAVKGNKTLGKEMFKAWNESKAESFLKNRKTEPGTAAAEYPYYVIYWKVGVTRRLLSMEATNYFKVAEQSALFNKRNYTIYAAGLAINAERLAYIYTKIGINDINKLKNKALEFLVLDPPDKFKKIFIEWVNVLEDIKNSPLKEQKNKLLQLSSLVPVL